MRTIVRDALAQGAGTTLPTNAHYQERHGIGAGTMQRALTTLESHGALTTISRGHLGRTIKDLDIGAAWHTGGLPPIRLLLPPSGPPEIDALASALSERLTEHNVPHTVHHIRGGLGRLEAVRNGAHDLAVVSRGALSQTMDHGTPATPHLILPEGTYYAPETLVTVTRRTSRPVRRVAIDTDSFDHVAFTRAEFPEADGYAYVPCPFTRVPAAVLSNEVDAGIWHRTRTVIPLGLAGLATAPLRRPQARQRWETLSRAVLVGWPGRGELAAVLGILDQEAIVKIQRQALTTVHDE